jgi:hypothetical protein
MQIYIVFDGFGPLFIRIYLHRPLYIPARSLPVIPLPAANFELPTIYILFTGLQFLSAAYCF